MIFDGIEWGFPNQYLSDSNWPLDWRPEWMTKPYSMELRQRAVQFVKAGDSRHSVARRLGVSVSCVVKWLLRHEVTGSVRPGKVGGHRPRKIVGVHREWVLNQIAAGGNVTLQGLADDLAVRGLKVDYRTMWNFVHREGKSFKKNSLWR
jgi:putative transposase